LKEEEKLLGFLGIDRAQVDSVKYEIERGERYHFGYLLKFIVYTKLKPITFYAKLRHRDSWENPTTLEHKMTLVASELNISPPSIIIADTLVIRGIDNGISLADLTRDSEWTTFFLENEEYLVKEIGEAYGKLNKIAGITHLDIKRDHIFITKDKKVYLIDFSTQQGNMILSSRWDTGLDKKIDTDQVKFHLDILLDLIYHNSPTLLREKQDSHVTLYVKWLQEGYDEIKEAETYLIDLIDIDNKGFLSQLLTGIKKFFTNL